MARRHDIGTWFGFEIQALVPVHGHVLDELESVHERLVMLGEVGGHLQGRIEGDVKSQLVADGMLHSVALVPADDFAHVGLEDARRVVHRAALQSRERQNCGVPRLDATAELRSHRALVANHVGPGAAQSRRAHGLVGVHHDAVLGGFGDGIMIVVVNRLAVVSFSVGNDGTHIAALDGVVSVLVHQVVGFLHPTLVVHR